LANTIKNTIKTRKIAELTADGVDEEAVELVVDALKSEQAMVDLIAVKLGKLSEKTYEFLAVKVF